MVICFIISIVLLLTLTFLPVVFSFAALAVLLGIIVYFTVKKKNNFAFIFIVVFIYCINLCVNNVGIYEKTKNIAEQKITANCTVTERQNQGIMTVINVKVNSCDTLPKGTGIKLLFFDENGLKPGSIINVTATVSAVKENILSNRSNGVALAGNTEDYTLLNKPSRLYAVSDKLYTYIVNTFENNLKHSDLPTALFTGDKLRLDNTFTENVRRAGVSHVLVVSGLHLSVICGSVYFVLKCFKTNKYLILIISLIEAFVLITLCNFTASVLRSAISFVITVYGFTIMRRSRGMETLFASAEIIMLFNPYAVCDVSFLLSFAATFGIIYFYPITQRFVKLYGKNGFTEWLLLTVFTTFSAFVCVLPVSIYFFGYVSVVGVFVNILVSFSVTVLLILGIILLLVNLLPFLSVISKILSAVIDIISSYFKIVVNYFGSKNYAVLNFRNTKVLTAAVILIFVIIYACKNKHNLLKLLRGENYADR